MRVLLTGATGFIGSYLAQYLIDRGYQVRCLVRTSSNLKWIADLNVECFYGSLQNLESLKNALADVDYIFHLAGVTKGLTEADFTYHNVTGTKKLLQAVLESDRKLKRFLFVSSQAAIGPSTGMEALTEEAIPHPVTPYGRSKLQAEQLVHSLNGHIPYTIVRPPAVYGPRDADVLQFFKTVKMGILPKLNGHDQCASIIHVKDLVRGIHLAATRKKAIGQTYFIANPQPASWDHIARVTSACFGHRAVAIAVPGFLLDGISLVADGWSKLTAKPAILGRHRVNEMKQDFWICSAEKIKKELRFESKIKLDDGICETLDWYKKHKWI